MKPFVEAALSTTTKQQQRPFGILPKSSISEWIERILDNSILMANLYTDRAQLAVQPTEVDTAVDKTVDKTVSKCEVVVAVHSLDSDIDRVTAANIRGKHHSSERMCQIILALANELHCTVHILSYTPLRQAVASTSCLYAGNNDTTNNTSSTTNSNTTGSSTSNGKADIRFYYGDTQGQVSMQACKCTLYHYTNTNTMYYLL
jgi:hypothetical protein